MRDIYVPIAKSIDDLTKLAAKGTVPGGYAEAVAARPRPKGKGK